MNRRPARRPFGAVRNAPVSPVPRAERSRRPLRVLLSLAVLLLLAAAADRVWLHLTTAPVFEVRRVSITGLRHADAERLREAAGLEGRNVLNLDLKQARARLLEQPWVCDARLRRRLPDAVTVEIDETVPAALERRGEALVLLDEQGAVLEENVARGRFELPMLEGAEASEARARAALVLALLREATPELWGRLESIDASRPDRLVLTAAGHPPIWLSGPESLDELLRWVSGAEELERVHGRPAHVDARWRDRLYLGRS